jgi:hypothetical protein
VADGDAAGLAEAEVGSGLYRVGANAGFDAQDVGGAAGQGEGGVAADHAVGDFVDGAIAAEDDDPFRALGDLLLGEGAGGRRGSAETTCGHGDVDRGSGPAAGVQAYLFKIRLGAPHQQS